MARPCAQKADWYSLSFDLAQAYQMRQLISIVYSHHRERDADLLALAAEGRMYARSLIR